MSSYKALCTAPVVLVAVVISVLSHMPSPPAPDMGLELQDKILHIIAYTVFGASLGLALYAWRPKWTARHRAWVVVVGTALFGVYDEVHQSFVPHRQAGVDDWIADCIGGVLSLLFLPLLAKLAAVIQQRYSTSDS